MIRCRNRVACSELAFATKSVLAATKGAFATEIVVPAAKQFSLLNCGADNEPVFVAELYDLHRISFRS